MDREFDSVAHEIEVKLIALRHLLAETLFLTDEQEKVLSALTALLRDADAQASELRRSLLGVVEEDLPRD